MALRKTASQSLNRIIGADRTDRIRAAESKARSRLIDLLDVEGKRPVRGPRKAAPAAKKAAPKKPKKLTRAQKLELLGQNAEGFIDGSGPVPYVAADPIVPVPETDATRHHVLLGLHEVLQPRTYFEIGISDGRSLTRSRTKTIGVDPFYAITAPVRCDVSLFRETSDDFFKLPDAFDHFDGVPVDLAFIDGMHLSEYALRDFMNTEKHMARTGVIVIDDMLPRNSLEAFRIRRTGPWTGDVYKIHEVFAKYRPDLTIIPLNAHPTGSYVVVGLDPTSTVLDDNYAEIEAEITKPDPQVVDQEWLERRTAADADEFLASDVWADLVKIRDAGEGDVADLWRRLAALPRIGDR